MGKVLTNKARIFEAGRSSEMIAVKAKGSTFTNQELLALLSQNDNVSKELLNVDWANRKISQAMKKDIVRDTLAVVFFGLVDNYRDYPDTDIATAARGLYNNVERFRGLQSMKLGEESNAMKNLLSELKSATNQGYIAAIPTLGKLVTALEAAEADFTAANVAYFTTIAGKGPTASELKKQLISVINSISSFVSVLATIDAETYGEFSKYVDLVIDRVNRNVRARLNGEKVPFPELDTDENGNADPEGDDVTPTDEPNPTPGQGGQDTGDNTGTTGTGNSGQGDDDESMPSA